MYAWRLELTPLPPQRTTLESVLTLHQTLHEARGARKRESLVVGVIYDEEDAVDVETELESPRLPWLPIAPPRVHEAHREVWVQGVEGGVGARRHRLLVGLLFGRTLHLKISRGHVDNPGPVVVHVTWMVGSAPSILVAPRTPREPGRGARETGVSLLLCPFHRGDSGVRDREE